LVWFCVWDAEVVCSNHADPTISLSYYQITS